MKYLAAQELLDAKKVAHFLKRPLLLSGEPGTGKTKFADYIAEVENYSLKTFPTKSISQCNDLFYNYDTISHFANKEKHVLYFLKLQALGIAILNALGKNSVIDKLKLGLQNDKIYQSLSSDEQTKLLEQLLSPCTYEKTLVLIDEVDKAPRDFPNDILNEIENYEFKIKELDITFSLKDNVQQKENIFIILTSNFEKNLPDAFLRRCIYYNIKFPDKDELLKIILCHIEKPNDEIKQNISDRIDDFNEVRKNDAIQKKPATSELIDCIKYLIHTEKTGISLKDNKAVLMTILKKNTDLATFN